MAASKHTHARAQCSHANVGLAHARPKYAPNSKVRLITRVYGRTSGRTATRLATATRLENVEHCGGEPEQADTACLLPN